MIRLPRPAALLAFALLVLSAHASAAEKRPMQVDDLFKFKRVAAPRISPDGTRVVYQLTTVNLEANKSSTAIYIADTDGKTPPKPLTDPKGKRDANPQWSPDGKTILFESNRSGTSQLYILDLAAGGEARQITTISTGAGNAVWSRDGSKIAFVSAVYPEFSEKPFAESDKLNKAKEEEIEKSPVKAKTFTKLFYRHWDEYVGDKRQHLFVCNADGSECRDVTPGDRDAFPTSTTFGTDSDFTFSPDGQFLVFTAVPEKDAAWSTNYDLCRVSITNTSPKWETLTKDNPAADGSPQFSPDGKRLAWRAQKKAGYEADAWDIVSTACEPDGTLSGKPVRLAPGSVNEFVWQGDKILRYTQDDSGKVSQFVTWIEDGHINGATLNGVCSSLSVSREGARVAVLAATMTSPADVFVHDYRPGGQWTPINISHANDGLLAELDLPKPESVHVDLKDGFAMQMWILKPPGFDEKKKWPVVYLVHGGPQGAWSDGWSYRWNPEVWAARGYVIVMPNPRGSTGFGQKFTDEITGDWGGKCYRDLVAGLDYVEKLPYVDKDRIASAGASFGGYMMNWFAVNDIAPRFKCLITHCSVWNFESMWGTTDELWFDEYEHGGLPWEKPGKYREFSPHAKAGNLAKNKVPMLVIHNDLDFRCPIGQGHELFTTLQRLGVPSRMVNFPDEGHWVLKPQNSRHWHKEVFAWLEKYCPPGGK